MSIIIPAFDSQSKAHMSSLYQISKHGYEYLENGTIYSLDPNNKPLKIEGVPPQPLPQKTAIHRLSHFSFTDNIYHTGLVKCSINLSYKFTIFVRRVTDPAQEGLLWIGASFQDEDLEWIKIKGGITHFHYCLRSHEVRNEWTKVEFCMGSKQRHKLYLKTKFACVSMAVRGSNHYEVCGPSIEII